MYFPYDNSNLEHTKFVQEHEGITFFFFFITFSLLITSTSFHKHINIDKGNESKGILTFVLLYCLKFPISKANIQCKTESYANEVLH